MKALNFLFHSHQMQKEGSVSWHEWVADITKPFSAVVGRQQFQLLCMI
jgi:hypothetical protein